VNRQSIIFSETLQVQVSFSIKLAAFQASGGAET
jgi:hypothetical protein